MNDAINITGLVETKRMLLNLAADLAAAGFEPALGAASAVVEEELGVRTPVRKEEPADGEREFEPLSKTIITEVWVNPSKNFGVASTGFGKSGPVALWEEYGHRIVTHAGVDTGKQTEPKPFMRQTTDACADAAIEAFRNSLANTLKGQYGS